MFTGAGGSIGSELTRQLSRYAPSRLILLNRDESALHALRLTLDGTGLLTSGHLILAHVRDAQRIRGVFMEACPEIVLRAAALKHLPLFERPPSEAFKTNILGTRTVLEVAQGIRVPVFVNNSNDKAADPTSILGFSRLMAERLAAGIPPSDCSRHVSARFGNLPGSRDQ